MSVNYPLLNLDHHLVVPLVVEQQVVEQQAVQVEVGFQAEVDIQVVQVELVVELEEVEEVVIVLLKLLQ